MRFIRFIVPLLVLGLWGPRVVPAQSSHTMLTGQVVDNETGDPLPGAHVFIAASMMGTATDDDGRYALPHVPLGAHRVYVSMLGYEPAMQDTLLKTTAPYDIDFQLKPTVLEFGEVVVSAKSSRQWEKQLRRFERLFLGETDNARETIILNPEVLSFDSGFGRLSATADEPLLIENRALGYRIQYFLTDFVRTGGTIKYDGEPLYEEMVPENKEQAARWTENRRKAFNGSFRHYMLTLLHNRWEEEGFTTYRRFSLEQLYSNIDRFPINPEQLLNDIPEADEKELAFPGFLEVVYHDEAEDRAYLRWQGRSAWNRPGNQRSWIRLTDGPTTVDHHGEVLAPYGVTVYGYFAFERVADELPKEYRPREWNTP